ncbi:hypothetical protein MNBD_GAMMA16-1953 [hydrothermal vent metagenome]|uniref:BatD n=1 Tax=hydrothermal vent metagenome TaxID=652676 RepID=A0A3B0Z3U7_9ZZZZ
MKNFFYKCLIGCFGVFTFLICTTAFGKPSAPIEMQYIFDSAPKLGEILQVDIQFSTSQTTDEIKASVKTTKGLHLQTMQHSYNLPLNREGDTTLMTIRLIPQEAGLNYLHVTAHVKVRGKNQAKAFSIPVTIGLTKQSQKTSRKTDTPNNKPKIIYLPAIERVQ